jgi:hypothetical protein
MVMRPSIDTRVLNGIYITMIFAAMSSLTGLSSLLGRSAEDSP